LRNYGKTLDAVIEGGGSNYLAEERGESMGPQKGNMHLLMVREKEDTENGIIAYN